MKKIMLLACFAAFVAGGCNKEEKLGAPTNLPPIYTLPQEGASAGDNARIMELFDEYSSYFLYDYTPKDAFYNLMGETGSGMSSTSSVDFIRLGDPRYVGPMLDVIEEAWLRYPAIGKYDVPLRVFLADSVGTFSQSKLEAGVDPYTLQLIHREENSIVISGMNEKLLTMDETARDAFVLNLTKALFPFTIPEPFWTISTYGTAAQQKTWVVGGTYYESILPGGTASLVITGMGNLPADKGGPDGRQYVTINGVEYSYNIEEARLGINRELAKMGFPPQLDVNNPTNPQIYATPFGIVNRPENWTYKNLTDYERGTWSNWMWATDEQIEASGFFTDDFPLMQEKFNMLVKAYEDQGLPIRDVANGR